MLRRCRSQRSFCVCGNVSRLMSSNKLPVYIIVKGRQMPIIIAMLLLLSRPASSFAIPPAALQFISSPTPSVQRISVIKNYSQTVEYSRENSRGTFIALNEIN